MEREETQGVASQISPPVAANEADTNRSPASVNQANNAAAAEIARKMAESSTPEKATTAFKSLRAVEVSATSSRAARGADSLFTYDLADEKEKAAGKKDPIFVEVANNTRITIGVNRGGFYVKGSPALYVLVPGWTPNAGINEIRYDFASASFSVDTTAWLLPKGQVIGSILNATVKPLLPQKLQDAGFDPMTDKDILAEITEFATKLSNMKLDDVQAAATEGKEAMKDVKIPPLKDVGGKLTVALPVDFRAEIDGGQAEVFIPKDSQVTLDVSTSGAVDKPLLQKIVVSASGAVVRSGQTVLPIHKMTLTRGGDITFEHKDSPTKPRVVKTGAKRKGKEDAGPDISDTDLDNVLERDARSAFHKFLQQYEGLVPGVSLREILGIPDEKKKE